MSLKNRLVGTAAAMALASGAMVMVGPAPAAQAAGSQHRVFASNSTCRNLLFADAQRLRDNGHRVTTAFCSKRVNSSITDGYLKWL